VELPPFPLTDSGIARLLEGKGKRRKGREGRKGRKEGKEGGGGEREGDVSAK